MRIKAGLLATFALLLASAAHAQSIPIPGPTVDAIKSRGQLVCGVDTGIPGFAFQDSAGAWHGFDVDYCRAIAAATLGDPAKVRFVPLTSATRFTALQSGEIDVLLRNSTETYARDTSLGLNVGPINFFDGQGFAVRKDAGIKSVADLGGATICMAQGTTHEQNALEWFASRGLKFTPVVFESQDTLYAAFYAKRCDALSQDSSALAISVATVAPNAADYTVLPERISKEPLGPFTRQGDETWSKIVRWTLGAMIEAEELGVTQANAEELGRTGSPAQKRLAGTGDDLGKPLGLDPKWSLAVIRAVGNYGESYERNLGAASSMKLPRGINDLWTKGGLMYAVPVR